MNKDNEQVDSLGQTLDAGSSTIKDVNGFFEKILVGILRHIFSVLWHIPIWIWKIVKYIAVKIFKNFAQILRFLYRLIKLAIILALLAAIVGWPFFFGQPWLVLWLIFAVFPGICLGIRIWYIKYKKRKSDERKRSAAADATAEENNDTPVEIIDPYIVEPSWQTDKEK